MTLENPDGPYPAVVPLTTKDSGLLRRAQLKPTYPMYRLREM